MKRIAFILIMVAALFVGIFGIIKHRNLELSTPQQRLLGNITPGNYSGIENTTINIWR